MESITEYVEVATIKYKAEDGTVFSTPVECLKHEQKQKGNVVYGIREHRNRNRNILPEVYSTREAAIKHAYEDSEIVTITIDERKLLAEYANKSKKG